MLLCEIMLHVCISIRDDFSWTSQHIEAEKMAEILLTFSKKYVRVIYNGLTGLRCILHKSVAQYYQWSQIFFLSKIGLLCDN